MPTNILLLLVAYGLAIGGASWYVYGNRGKLGCLHCMQIGMVFGGITGLVVGTLYALQTGDYIWSMIFGTLAGLVAGVPLGLLGGHMGRMEAVMAAPMGGFMGGMLGIMVRVYDVNLFVSFFTAIVGVMMAEMAYVIFKTVNQRRASFFETAFASVLIASVVLATTFGGFGLDGGQNPGFAFLSGQQAAAAQAPSQVIQAQATAIPLLQAPSQTGEVQEVTIKAEQASYEPNSIQLKAGIPVKITLQADANAGCSRSFAIRKLGVRKTLTPGTSEVVEIGPQPAGRLDFSCSMGMVRGSMEFT